MRAVGTGSGTLGVQLQRHSHPTGDLLEAWDEFVRATPGTDVTQLSVWARVRAAEKFSPVYLFAYLDGRLVGGAQVLVRRFSVFGSIGYVPYGPLVAAPASARADVVEALARDLTSLPGVRMLFVQPPEHGDHVRGALLRRGCRPSSAGIAPTGSVRLDLRRSEDDIRRGFAPRLRSMIRRWPAEGVRVRLGGLDDVPVLAELMERTAADRGFRAPSADYLRHMVAELERSGNGALFIGEVHGAPVTADLVTVCGGMVRGRLGGFDRSAEGARLHVPGAARWAIIRWAKEAGYDWLDFGGLSEQALRDADDRGITSCGSWPGSDQAKMRFGGVAFRYPGPVELIRPALLRLSYDVLSARGWGRSALHRAEVALRHGAHRGLPSTVPARVARWRKGTA